MLVALNYLFFLGLVAYLLRPLSVALHELGHAIPALIFTKEPVKIYLGNMGDEKNTGHIRTGRLQWFLSIGVKLWYPGTGLVSHGVLPDKYTNALVTAGGALLSFFTALLFSFVIVGTKIHGLGKFVCLAFALYSFFDFFINIVPAKRILKLDDGSFTFNDGFQLRQLLKGSNFIDYFREGMQHYQERNYADALKSFNLALKEDRLLYETWYYKAYILYHLGFDQGCVKIIDEMMNSHTLSAELFSLKAAANARMGAHEQTIHDYTQAMAIDPGSSRLSNGRGYAYLELEAYIEAIRDFDAAIKLDPEAAAFPYNNRGYAKLMLGLEEPAYKDILQSIELDPNNSYAYRNLGIYYMQKQQYDEAFDQFKKATLLDFSTPRLSMLMSQCKSYLQKE